MAPTLEMGQSFGLGFAVRTDAGRNPLPGSVGTYYWAGAFGTTFWIDPQTKMFAVMMVSDALPTVGLTTGALFANWSMGPCSPEGKSVI